MRPTGLLVAASVVFAASSGLHAGQAVPPVAPAGAPARGGPGAAPSGRGGGRGNPMAAKFTEVCASCHGTTTAKGPVGPSLFDAEWVHGGDDDAIVKSIKDGYPEKGMPPFKETLNDQEIWQMVAYLHTQAASLQEKPVYVP